MTEIMEELEGGLPRLGHREEDGPPGPVILGRGEYRYEISGQNWGNKPEDWVYREATAVAVDREDRVYVFNRGTAPVMVFAPDGTMVDAWGKDIFDYPHGITVAPDGNLFCVDTGDGTIRKVTPQGRVLMTLGGAHDDSLKMTNKPFCVPTHVGVDPRTNEFYISDGYSNAAVHKFSPDGDYLFTFGESGTDEGQFNIVHNVKVDRHGWVYVADRENHRVQVFSDKGRFETQWVNLSRAACIDIDTSGERDIVYIGEYFSGIASNDTGTNLGPRVTVMTTDGKVLSRVGTQAYGSQAGRFFSPHGIAVDSKGDLYVAEVAHSDYGSGWNVKRELRSMQKLVRVRNG